MCNQCLNPFLGDGPPDDDKDDDDAEDDDDGDRPPSCVINALTLS